MRPVLPPLSALAGAGCLLALTVTPAAAADADATPRLVEPGRTVTVLVSCDPVEGSIPGGIEATSPAFVGEVAQLERVSADEEDPRGGPAYRGRAKISDEAEFDTSRAASRTSEWDVAGLCPGGEQWTAAFRIDEKPEKKSQKKSEKPKTRPGEGADGASPTPGAARGQQADPSASPASAHDSTERVRTGVAEEGQVNTAALAGGSALLIGAVVGAVCWRRRAVVGSRARTERGR